MPYYYPGARCITRHDHPLPGLGTVPAGALVEVKGYALDLLIVESIATGAVFSAAPSALEPEPLPVRPEPRHVALPRFERLGDCGCRQYGALLVLDEDTGYFIECYTFVGAFRVGWFPA